VGEKGVGSEVRKWEVKASPIRKTTVRRLEVFWCSEVVVAAGTSKWAAVLLGAAQEFVDRATVAKNMVFLVARSECSDYRSVQSSQSSGRVLAARCTGVGNDEESSVAGEHNSAMERMPAG